MPPPPSPGRGPTTPHFRAAQLSDADLGLPGHPMIPRLAEWLRACVRTFLAQRRPPCHWQWGATLWRVGLDWAGIARVARSKEAGGNGVIAGHSLLLSTLGAQGGDRRLRPYAYWAKGQSDMAPGAGCRA